MLVELSKLHFSFAYILLLSLNEKVWNRNTIFMCTFVYGRKLFISI